MSFKNLALHDDILKAVDNAGFTKPTPIQSEAIPVVIGGQDLRASAQTGTGKTAAYLLPSLQRMTKPRPTHSISPRILILVPTRELAIQVADEAVKYSQFLPRTKTVCIYGGAPYPVQNRQLSRPCEILVATPGRLIDHLERGRVDLSHVEILILDEADRMLDMGFIEPVEQIAARTPATRQTLLFSATMQGSVLKLSQRLLKNPIEVSIAQPQEKHKNIEQRLYLVDDLHHKYKLLSHMLNGNEINQAIIFTSTKRFAEQLVEQLDTMGCQAAALHGDMHQRQRQRTISKLRDGTIRFLVATDVAARGIDVQTISHVINFDLPYNPEDYVHRIGRTGRAGANGLAFSFAARADVQLVKRIEKFTGQPIEAHTVAGLEPSIKMDTRGPKPSRGGPQRRPYNKGRGFSDNKGRGFSANKERSFSDNKSRSFSDNKERSFSDNKGRSFSANKERSFSDNKSRSFSDNKERSFSDEKGRSFSDRRPAKKELSSSEKSFRVKEKKFSYNRESDGQKHSRRAPMDRRAKKYPNRPAKGMV